MPFLLKYVKYLVMLLLEMILSQENEKPQIGRKYLNNISDIGFVYKIYKNSSKPTRRKTNFFKGKDLNRHLMNEDAQMANKRMKRCLKSCYQELQIKTRYDYIPIEWLKLKTKQNKTNKNLTTQLLEWMCSSRNTHSLLM